mmetsp:Transcript_92737/g.153425  ORF Transcript_92737/g.153425 Transcript_92737/m.153425 type:complete len:103 (-) Transcript_92737:77-385(-)
MAKALECQNWSLKLRYTCCKRRIDDRISWHRAVTAAHLQAGPLHSLSCPTLSPRPRDGGLQARLMIEECDVDERGLVGPYCTMHRTGPRCLRGVEISFEAPA